jgi:hypothetical protein
MERLSIKLIKNSLYPATLMILGKALGLLIAGSIYDTSLQVVNTDRGISNLEIIISDMNDLRSINTFANGVMLLILVLPFIYFLVKAFFWHESHQSPKILVKLNNLSLENLMGNSIDIYIGLFSWLVYLWLGVGIVFVDVYQDKAFRYILYLSIFIVFVFSWLSIKDVIKELKQRKEALT